MTSGDDLLFQIRDDLNRRLDSIERRLENIETRLNNVHVWTTGEISRLRAFVAVVSAVAGAVAGWVGRMITGGR